MTTTVVRRWMAAAPAAVYDALVDPAAVQRWMVPEGMSSEVHVFDATEGGTFRISLTYDQPDGIGKTTPATDSFEGRFVRLRPGAEVVQVVAFETDDDDLAGTMTITYRLAAVDGGTEVTGIHEGVPPGVSAADNEEGWRQSLDHLASIVEAHGGGPRSRDESG